MPEAYRSPLGGRSPAADLSYWSIVAHAVIFDMDGVLVDSEVIAAQIESEMFTQAGVAISVDDIYEHFVGLSEASMIDALRRDWNLEVSASFLDERLARIAARFDAAGQAIPGIGDVVSELVGRGTPLAVASSSRPEAISHKLAVTGLDGFFGEHIYSASMVAHGKPAPDLFLHAADRLGVDAGECVLVEDSAPGVTAGVAAGMTVIGFTAGGHCRPGHAQRLLDAGATHIAAAAVELVGMIRAPR